MIGLLLTGCVNTQLENVSSVAWEKLPDVPDRIGFAGPFAGVSDGALIVAGGANFPKELPWEGGTKVWYDSIFALSNPDGDWKMAGRLPRPLGYGLSFNADSGILCVGGSDAHRHYPDVFLLSWDGKRMVTKTFPFFPVPLANSSGVMIRQTVYVAGGITEPTATHTLRDFYSLDLDHLAHGWRKLEPWPGSSRMLPVAGTDGRDFYLFGGTELTPDANGKPLRRYLTDCYRYSPGNGWTRIADMPRAAVAAPSPAIWRNRGLLVVSGEDGKLVNFEPKSMHPGFPKNIISYDPKTDRWTELEESPISRATVPTTLWRGMAVIPNGEARPGYRTPEVWGMKLR